MASDVDEISQSYETFFFNLDEMTEAPDEIYEAFDEYIAKGENMNSVARDSSNFYNYYFTDYTYAHMYIEINRTLFQDEATAILTINNKSYPALSTNLRICDSNDIVLDEDLQTETWTSMVGAAVSASKGSSSYAYCNFGVMTSENGSMYTKRLTTEM